MGHRLLISIRRWLHRGRTGGFVRTNPLLITILLSLLLAMAAIGLLELRLRPVVEAIAVVQVQNRVTSDVNTALRAVCVEYHDLVNLQYDQQGAILALTTDMSAVNRVRNQVAEQVLSAIECIDVHELGVPLGSLFDMDLAWAKGPAIRVHSLVAGSVRTQMHSEFTAAGINQTRHQIVLEIVVPLVILLPGMSANTEVTTQICVAETVIVGRVPETFLELPH